MSDPRPRHWIHYVRDMLGACDEGSDYGAFVADARAVWCR